MTRLLLSLFVTMTSAAAWAQLTDEIIVSAEETGRDWNAELVQSHEIWKKGACSAYTMSEDKESTLEVVAFYNPATDGFSEPEVNIVTQANFSFLDVTASTNGTSRDFQLLPIQPDNPSLVGARVLFDEREDLVFAIRRHLTLTAHYLDSAGEVKSVNFSLRGSSNAIAAQFERCGLEFLPELDLPEPL